MAEKPKIDEATESLSQMSKNFDQIMILFDCLDRLVESKNVLEKVKLDVNSFITDFERRVKDFTNHETVLTALLHELHELSCMSTTA